MAWFGPFNIRVVFSLLLLIQYLSINLFSLGQSYLPTSWAFGLELNPSCYGTPTPKHNIVWVALSYIGIVGTPFERV
jgi:hypothetical protein